MPERTKFAVVGRNLLLSVAVGTLPITGCVEVEPVPAENANMIPATRAEKAKYEIALRARNAEQATEFMISYPESELIRPILASMAASEIRRIPKSAVNGVDPDVLLTLPDRVKRLLGLSSIAPSIGSTSSGSDGYSG